MNLQKHIANTFLKHHINLGDMKLLLAVSGGKDSMVLLYLMSALKVNFEVAHMNYQLRDEDANLDQALVEKVCREKRIICHIKKVDTKLYCEKNKVSTQEGARLLRYDWFDTLLTERKLDYIVTAHHESDNHETFIQNLKRGSGLRGLKSMVFLQNGRCKPLLDVSRELIDKYAKEYEVDFRQDASNNQNHYLRNLIRNEVLPSIEEQLPGFKKGVSTSITNLQSDYDYLIDSLEKDCNSVLIEENGQFVIRGYKELHRRLLWYILEKFQFNEVQSQDVWAAKQAGKAIQNNNYAAVVNQGDLIIYQNTKVAALGLKINKTGSYDLGDATIKLSFAEVPESFSSEKHVAWVDAEKIEYPLIVRNWEAGDKFKPLGMKGSKKISDFLTDMKMPVHQKERVKVLISRGEILWVLNQGVSDFCKIDNSTKKVIKLETILK